MRRIIMRFYLTTRIFIRDAVMASIASATSSSGDSLAADKTDDTSKTHLPAQVGGSNEIRGRGFWKQISDHAGYDAHNVNLTLVLIAHDQQPIDFTI
jgi:hypothetical protein